MNIFVIGDEPLVEAFEMIGVPGRVPAPNQEIGELLHELATGRGAELVLLQSSLAARLSDGQLDNLAYRLGCLVIDVPGVGESGPDSTTLLRSVQSAIGAVI